MAFGGSTQFDELRWKETGFSNLQSVESRVCVFLKFCFFNFFGMPHLSRLFVYAGVRDVMFS